MILLFRKKHVFVFTSITETNRLCKISTHTYNLIGLQLAEPVNQTAYLFSLDDTRLFLSTANRNFKDFKQCESVFDKMRKAVIIRITKHCLSCNHKISILILIINKPFHFSAFFKEHACNFPRTLIRMIKNYSKVKFRRKKNILCHFLIILCQKDFKH